jgi:sec-independent protein translocase protein TatC
MPAAVEDDLFQSSTMTFGEHLEELRGCLVRASAGLFVGVLLGLALAKPVVKLIEAPLKRALGDYYSQRALDTASTWSGTPLPYSEAEIRDAVENRSLTFELREVHADRLPSGLALPGGPTPPADGRPQPPQAAGSSAAASTGPFPADTLVPILLWQPLARDARVSITTLSAQEAFGIYIKAALLVGIVLASPWIFHQLWMFVAAGLYPHEKRLVHVFLPVSLGLFLSGVIIAFYPVLYYVLDYLLQFNESLGLDPDPRISEWMSFVLILPVGFGLGFQLPLVMLFLSKIGIFDADAYASQWRMAVLVICIISALLTPADPYSMLFLAAPLCLLYFGGVAVCRWSANRDAAADGGRQLTKASQ